MEVPARAWLEVIRRIREKFGDENLYFTFLVEDRAEPHKLITSTFAIDNIEHLEPWLLLIHTRFTKKREVTISIVVRVFLKEQVPFVLEKEGKVIWIPKKKIYHILVALKKLMLFDEKETYGAQNTDAMTGQEMEAEVGVVHESSIELLQELGFIDANGNYIGEDYPDDEEPVVIDVTEERRSFPKRRPRKKSYSRQPKAKYNNFEKKSRGKIPNKQQKYQKKEKKPQNFQKKRSNQSKKAKDKQTRKKD